jgi:hypothetical protein
MIADFSRVSRAAFVALMGFHLRRHHDACGCGPRRTPQTAPKIPAAKPNRQQSNQQENGQKSVNGEPGFFVDGH